MTVIPPPGFPAGDAATEAFACHRDLLFAVVYSMLGSVTDTEDVLRETSWQEAPGGPTTWPRAAAGMYHCGPACLRLMINLRQVEKETGPADRERNRHA
jgi:hypothetical protein